MTADRRDTSYQEAVMDSLQQLLARFDRIELKLDSLLAEMSVHKATQAGLEVEVTNLKERVYSLEEKSWKIIIGVIGSILGIVAKTIFDVISRR